MDTNNKRIAVLIDAENISYKYIDEVLDEVALYGRATHKRIYGDFTKAQLKGWNGIANEHSLHQVTQISYTKGKNSSDSVLIINAMDLLYEGNVEAICIVSSDSDFTRLAMRIVESGLDVIGMGDGNTAESFINACTVFKFLGAEDPEERGPAMGEPEEKESGRRSKKAEADTGTVSRRKAASVDDKRYIKAPRKVIKAIYNAIMNLDTDSSGWVKISLIGEMLHNRFPDFDPTIWGAKSKQLSSFLMQLEDFEVEGRESNHPGAVNYYIRNKTRK
jgi:uncharacterized LabA/DUF88 family protein/Fe-S-cluster formation regulator IscX/YfhJ